MSKSNTKQQIEQRDWIRHFDQYILYLLNRNKDISLNRVKKMISFAEKLADEREALLEFKFKD